MNAARLISLSALGAFALSGPGDALEPDPPVRASGSDVPPSIDLDRDDAVTAIVVRSWGFYSGDLVWAHLNDHWSDYGSTPLVIDYVTLQHASTFTLEDLMDAGADVVIVSNPAGGTRQWTPEEIAALSAYAEKGHNLVGTFRLFQWHEIDNRELAPLWGIRSDVEFPSQDLDADASASVMFPSHCAFHDISSPMPAGGFRFVETPSDDDSWDEDDLDGAVFRARSASGRNVVTSRYAGSFRAFYISYMPEFQSGGDVEATQWLYNAITCATPTSVETASWGRVKSRYR